VARSVVKVQNPKELGDAFAALEARRPAGKLLLVR
jgi:hypothetical protein